MANEMTEIESQSTTTAVSALSPVTKAAVEALKQQRALLKDFVNSQLVEAQFKNSSLANFGEGDYGIIPGTKKRCLLKQGAEKLQKLFQLGCRFRLVDKTIDRDANFAMFTYRAELYSLNSGAIIAECEASVNSQETKYKERTKWTTNEKGVRVSTTEVTPIYDILNTIMKMAQKRAMIGATIIATGASEYFTQDVLDADEQHAPKAEASTTTSSGPAEAPTCCGGPMMISKYVDPSFGHAPYYCPRCKSKKSAEPTHEEK